MISTFFTVGISFVLSLIFEGRFYLESIRSMYDYTYYAFSLSSLLRKHKREGEMVRVSLKIKYGNNYYRVVRFSELSLKNLKYSKKFRQVDLPTGLLVVNEEGNILGEKEKVRKILEVYNIWHYFYINPLFQDISTNKFFLQNALYFNELMVEGIKKRRKDEYQKILNKSNKQYTEILKELDDQVLKQSPFLKSKVEAQIQLIRLLYEIWEHPSDAIYDKMEHLFEEIKKNASEENNVWNIRLNYWKKLEEYRAGKIDEIKPNLSVNKKTFFLTLIEIYLTKNFSFLGIALDKLYELSKYPLKHFLRVYNNKIVYHRFGIVAIKRNIVFNQKLKEVSTAIKRVKNEPTIQLLRT